MERNVIFSWADATWKTTRVEDYVKDWYHLSKLTKEIDILQNSIKKNIEIAINQWLQCNQIVMDRSIIDLLAYYYTNEREWLIDKNTWIWNLHWIKKILKEFILLNKWSIVYYMTASKKIIIQRLREREEKWEELSKNDLQIINKEGYLEDFIVTFNKLINILEILNSKMWNLIEIEKIDTTNLPKPLYETSI